MTSTGVAMQTWHEQKLNDINVEYTQGNYISSMQDGTHCLPTHLTGFDRLGHKSSSVQVDY